MPRLVWLTDLHLNFVPEDQIPPLAKKIRDQKPSAALIGGDLGEADSWELYLRHLDELLRVPIYFVLGNHDYYGSSIHAVRERARQLSGEVKRLHWLAGGGFVSLDSQTALVGHGGWGDARAADFYHSRVLLNDYFLISELKAAAAIPPDQTDWTGGDPSSVLNPGLKNWLHELGDETARHFREVVPRALELHEHVIVLMHVPPFREACWHDGRISDDNWAPHFCCIAAGEALIDIMKRHRQKRMTVLCGHTHSQGQAHPLPNLTVFTGQAKYGHPAVTQVFDTENAFPH